MGETARFSSAFQVHNDLSRFWLLGNQLPLGTLIQMLLLFLRFREPCVADFKP